MAKIPLGRLPREAIRMLDLPRLPQDMLEGYRRLVDLTGTVSDAMDELGIVGVVPAFVPRERAAEVLEAARKIDAGDTRRKGNGLRAKQYRCAIAHLTLSLEP
jgi:hypothetical protein